MNDRGVNNKSMNDTGEGGGLGLLIDRASELAVDLQCFKSALQYCSNLPRPVNGSGFLKEFLYSYTSNLSKDLYIQRISATFMNRSNDFLRLIGSS